MGLSRRAVLGTIGLTAGLAGCHAPTRERSRYTGTKRIYTCSYDATAAGLTDQGDAVQENWREVSFQGQTRDVLPDRDSNLLITDDQGVHKCRQYHDHIEQTWLYNKVNGSIRGITIDQHNNYYVGSWTADQGFHKIVEDNGRPQQAWVYHWENDTGMITGATDPNDRIALGLKNGKVHLLIEDAGGPELRWEWEPGTGEIIREVLWDHTGSLYVGCEDHHVYKLHAPQGGPPELVWKYDAENIVFGLGITHGDRLYIATNSGEIHCLRDRHEAAPHLAWRYQHTTYNREPPTDEYFWEGLAHQVAARPDNSTVYSCAYDGTVHKINPENGTAEKCWKYNGHSDNVREVRIRGEYIGTHPEQWPS